MESLRVLSKQFQGCAVETEEASVRIGGRTYIATVAKNDDPTLTEIAEHFTGYYNTQVRAVTPGLREITNSDICMQSVNVPVRQTEDGTWRVKGQFTITNG